MSYRKKLIFFAGPCQIESEDHAFSCAQAIKEITTDYPVELYYKSSFDKANRTSLDSQRGVGLKTGLQILGKIKNQLGLPTVTDIHLPEQAKLAAEYVDVLQIPAFLCRQTDLLLAAGATGKAVNIKKGQFLHPQDMQYCAEKVRSAGCKEIFLCERGSCFGYRELVVDFRGLLIMKELGYPVIFDATHSVQVMGGASGKSSGARQYVKPLAKAACAVGVDGLFVECHEDPERAPSDGKNMLAISNLKEFLDEICNIRRF